MAVGDMKPQEALGHELPLFVHSDTTTTPSNPRQGHDTNAARDQTDIKIVPAGAAAEPTAKTCDEAASTNKFQLRATQLRDPVNRLHPLSVIPRSKRRGLLGRFAIIPEINNSYEYCNSTKWGITATVSLATVVAPMGSSIFYRMHHSAPLIRASSSSSTS
jgi:hypothetical protein